MPVKGSKWGTAHQKRRAREIRKFRPGQACVRCGGPMLALYTISAAGKRIAAVQLDHDDSGNPNAYKGLAHSHCNESAGGTVGTERQGKATRMRVCQHCHNPFKASRKDQATCGRDCADALKRGDAPWPMAGRAW